MAAREREGEEEVGLSSWPMSSSYPVTRTQLEARKMIKYITSQRKETEVVLQNDAGEEEDHKDTKKGITERLLGLSSFLSTPQPEEDPPDVDEVDGLAEDLLSPLVKLVFLKILLVDIGISVGDVITDLLQGLSLVFDADWNLQWGTYHYGVGVLSIMWLPGLVVLLHQASGEATFQIFPENSHWATTFALCTIFFLLFPLVPTILYLRVLLTKRRFRTAHQKLTFLQSEANSHEIKAIAGSLESPLELILLLWLVLRGILQLPWDRPLTSSCVGDSLGRVACLPSLPMASIIFSLLSILKTLCDLNISPLVSKTNHANSIPKLGYTCHLIAQFCPFFVCNVLFRTTAFSFIITFLDYWALIPGIMVFVLCLAHTMLTSSSQSTEEEDLMPPLGDINQHDTRSSCSQEKDAAFNRTTPILLNSLLGVLLPIAYSPPSSESSINNSKLEFQVKALAQKQASNLRSQAFLVNTCTITVVITIYCLVTYTSTFNYWSNILSPWWFSAAFLYLLLLYLLSLLLSWMPELHLFNRNDPDRLSVVRQRHPTGESSCHSVHSTSSTLVEKEPGPSDLCLKILISLLLTLLAVAPSIAGIVLFKTLTDDDFHLMQINERDDGLIQRHFTHLIPLNPDWNGVLFASSSLAGCENLDSLENSLLLMNMSIAACRTLHRRMTSTIFLPQSPRSIIILEDLPQTRWRLSSPPPQLHLGQHLPVFRALAPDWSQGWTASQAVVVRGQEDNRQPSLSCSNGREIHIGEEREDKGCTRRKSLLEDGKIVEAVCIKTSCTKNGMPCQPTAVKQSHVECHTKLSSPLILDSELALSTPINLTFVGGKVSDSCCIDSSNYLQLIGKECVNLNLTNSIKTDCIFGETFTIQPCQRGQQEHTKFCNFPYSDCAISSTFLSLCEKTTYIKNICDIEDFYCNKVISKPIENV